LLDGSVLLITNQSWARAYALSQLAIEEYAKLPILFNLWIDEINGNNIGYKKFDDYFKNHSEKTKIVLESAIRIFSLYRNETEQKWVNNIINKGQKLISKLKELNDQKKMKVYMYP